MRINTPPSQIRGPGFNLQPGDPEKPQTVRAELNTIAQPNTRPNTAVASTRTVIGTGGGGGGSSCTCDPDLSKATGILGLDHGGTGINAGSILLLLAGLGVLAPQFYVLELAGVAPSSSSSSGVSSSSASSVSSSGTPSSSSSGSHSSGSIGSISSASAGSVSSIGSM